MQKKAVRDSQTVAEISDQQVQPQDVRKAVQKRTFTRWINVSLQRCNPPVEVHDLFTDIQDGRILMTLLEQLSGCKLLYRFRSSSHRIFRLNNISKALAFLDDRHVKLLGIDASGIADGIPSVVLNLIWNIILYFQVKEVTGGLQRHLSSSLSSLSMHSYPSCSDLSPQPNDTGTYSCYTLPSKGRKAAKESKYHGKAIKTLLQWVQRCTSKFGVEVYDFGKSWRSGLAFSAMIKSINPDLVDLRESFSRKPRENIELAFMIAHESLDIPLLLEPEDVTCTSPDEQSIITYVSMFLGHCSDINEDTTDILLPEIQHFASPESGSVEESTTHDPQAQVWLRSLVKGNEQLLWKRWSKTSSGSPCATLFQMNGAATSDPFSSNDEVFSPCHSLTEQSAGISPICNNKDRFGSVLQDVARQESQLWIDQGYDRQKVDEFSLSSEEGIYCLSALDSDEEDAYSYILDLHKEVFLPHSQIKSQMPRVEEETAEEINRESKHRDVCEMFNGSGCKHQDGSLAQNADIDLGSEGRAQSVLHKKEIKESSLGGTSNTRAVFDMQPDDKRIKKEPPDVEKDVRGQRYGEKERTEHGRVVTRAYNETEPRAHEAEKTEMFITAGWQKEVVGDKKGLPVNEKIVADDKEMNVTADGGKNRMVDEEEEDNIKDGDRENQQCVNLDSFEVGANETVDGVYEVRGTSATRITTAEHQDSAEDFTDNSKDGNKEDTTEVSHSGDFNVHFTVKKNHSKPKCGFTDKTTRPVNHLTEPTPKNDTGGCLHVHSCDSGLSATSHLFSTERRLLLQSPATSCDVKPLELEMLLGLWILLYCCLILPQMNL